MEKCIVSKYPKYTILKNLFYKTKKVSEINFEEIGDRKDVEELNEWLDSKLYTDLKKNEKPLAYIPNLRLPNPLKVLKNAKVIPDYKSAFTVEYLENIYVENDNDTNNFLKQYSEQDTDNTDGKIIDLEQFAGQGTENIDENLQQDKFLPQKHRVIYYKFFLKVIDEIESGEEPATTKFKTSVKQKIARLFDDIDATYFFTLYDDPYLNERIHYELILNQKMETFTKWKFSDYEGDDKESEEKLTKYFDKSFERISKANFVQKRRRFRKVAMQRMDTILNEIRKLGNMTDRSNYKFMQKEIQEIWKSITNEINEAFVTFKPIGPPNPYKIPKVIIDVGSEGRFKQEFPEQKLIKYFEENGISVKPQSKDTKGSDLEFELKSLKKTMQEKFAELESKINLSKEEKND